MKDLGIMGKVRRALEDSEYDAVIAVGADNVQYLSGALLPFLYSYPGRHVMVLWPRRSEPTCICPVEWASTVRNTSWIRRIRPYIERGGDLKAAVEALAEAVKETVEGGAKLGIDADRASGTFFNELRKALEGMDLSGCDGWLKGLRMTKTPQEAELLADVAYRTDHGILGAAHHVIVTAPKTEMALAEDIRVHCHEVELDMVGHHSLSQVASGEHSKKFWPLVARFGVGWEKMLKAGEMVRMEMRSSLDGYWSDAARMMTMGDPTPEQSKAYEDLVTLRKTAVNSLRPGARCSEVFRAVEKEAERRGIELVRELGVGHGVGVTTHEAPYLIDDDDTELRAGMILVLDPVIYGPDGEIMRSKDTVLITETGCRIIGWYKDWRELYIPAYAM